MFILEYGANVKHRYPDTLHARIKWVWSGLETFVLSDTTSARTGMSAVIADFKHWLPSARKIWLNVHLWLGLTAGFALALIGLTGSLIVVDGPLLRMQVGDIFDASGSLPSHLAIDDWIANAKRTYGDIKAVNNVVVSGPIGNAAMLSADVAGKNQIVTIDPTTGLPLGRYFYEDTFAAFNVALHAHFAASGSWILLGRTAVAWVGVAMLVSMATGLYLWWPRNRNWSTAFTLKRGARGRRRLLDLHNLFAVYLYVPLLIITFSGIYFSRPDWIDPAVSLVSVARTLDPAAPARASKPGSCPSPTTPGQAVDLALARFPTSKFVFVIISPQPEEPYLIQLAPPGNVGVKGDTQVSVDRVCPVILASIDGKDLVAAETFKALMHPLHGSLMLGLVGKVIVFLIGLLMPLSFVTGLLLWLNKRRNRVAGGT
jgi:uncharacterized iron-regulated membrane protein